MKVLSIYSAFNQVSLLKVFLAMPLVILAGAAQAQSTGNCTIVVNGPDTGEPIQTAIDQAAPGDTICLDGEFLLNAPLEVVDAVGLTLTSTDRDNRARLVSEGNAIELLSTTGVTVSHLDITAGTNGVLASVSSDSGIPGPLTSNLRVVDNYISAFFGVQLAGSPTQGEYSRDVLVARNVIDAQGIGVALISPQDATVRDSDIVISNPSFALSAGVATFNGAGNLTVSDNRITGPDAFFGAVQYGIWIDHFVFFLGTGAQENLDIKRNNVAGFHTGIAGLIGEQSFAAAIVDLDLLANVITCNPNAGLNGLGVAPTGVFLGNFGSQTTFDAVQLINNQLNQCSPGLLQFGNVTNVTAVGPPVTREALGFAHPWNAPNLAELGLHGHRASGQ